MSLVQIIVIALIQGVTELLPISDVVHAALPSFAFGWQAEPERPRPVRIPVRGRTSQLAASSL